MTARSLPALGEDVPATVSRPAMDGLLRATLGFQGVAVSDDLEMKAIADPAGAAVEAVRAGVDVLLVCHHAAMQRTVLDALETAARRGDISPERLEQAHRRIDALVRRFVRPAEDRVASLGSMEHQRLLDALHWSEPDVVRGPDPTARSDAPA
jgi:beta-N-acetylhexosaminidase